LEKENGESKNTEIREINQKDFSILEKKWKKLKKMKNNEKNLEKMKN